MKNGKNSDRNKGVTKRQVKQMIEASTKPLLKYVDTPFTVSTTGSIGQQALDMPTIGTGVQDMVGTTIVVKKFDICLQYTPGANTIARTSFSSTNIRTLLVQQVGESTVYSQDVLQYNGTATLAVTSPYTYDTVPNWVRVLWDKTVVVDASNTAANVHSSVPPSVSICRYDQVNSAWATGLPTFVYAVDVNGSGAGSGTIYGYIRMWYHDL